MLARKLISAAAAAVFASVLVATPSIATADGNAASDFEVRDNIRMSGDYRSSSSLAKNPPAALAEILSLTEKDGASTGDLKLRLNLIRETANRYAQQKALVWRTDQINRILEGMAPKLDVIFDFDPLLIDRVILPPSITRAEDAHRSYSPDTTRVIRKIYRIEYPARIVTSTPSWRSFLVRRLPPLPELPRQVLPRTSEEQAIWKEEAIKGWIDGLEQADTQFATYLNLLVRVIDGMVVYHQLMREGVVSRPQVATADRGVVFSPNGQELNIGDVIYRIAEPGAFQDSGKWQVIPRRDAVGPEPKRN